MEEIWWVSGIFVYCNIFVEICVYKLSFDQ